MSKSVRDVRRSADRQRGQSREILAAKRARDERRVTVCAIRESQRGVRWA